MRGDHLSRRGLVGIALGIVGMVVLLWPQLRGTGAFGRLELIASIGLLGGSLTWAIGSVLSKRWDHGGDPFVAGAWQMVFASVCNLAIGFAMGEQHHVHWTAHGIEAIAYLVVFGSLVGYTAYIYILKHAPTTKVSTYAYVNPVIAVFLGWLIMKERVDGYIMTGTAIIIAAVALVTMAKVTPTAADLEPSVAGETTGD